MAGWWITIGLLIAVIYFIYSLITKNHDHWAKRGVKYQTPLPFFGNMLRVVFRQDTFVGHFERFYSKFKKDKIVGMYEFTRPIMLATDPELIRDITVKHFDYFPNRRVVIGRLTDPLFERSLPSLQGAEWRAMRNRLSPAFTTSKLKAMLPLVNHCAETFSQFLVNRPKNEPLEFKAAYTRLTNDVIATVAFGYDSKAITNPNDDFYKLALEMTQFTTFKKSLILLGYMLVPWLMVFLKIPFLPKTCTSYFQNLIDSAMEYRTKSGQTRPDMLEVLMTAQKGKIESAPDDEQDVGRVGEDEQAADLHKKHLTHQAGDQNLITNEDIAAQAFIFFFAGFETIATMLAFLSHELAVNPNVQEKLRKEILETYEKCNGKINYDAIQSMKYMDMVVSESLRKYPPGSLTDRVCVKNFKVPDSDIVIEEGTSVMIPMYNLHHDPEYFPEPEKFDPERFNDENKKNIKPYTYLPFGSGPHNCIGMRLALLEIKLCVYHMLKSCDLQVSSKTQIPLKLSKQPFIMAAEAGVWLNAVPIENI